MFVLSHTVHAETPKWQASLWTDRAPQCDILAGLGLGDAPERYRGWALCLPRGWGALCRVRVDYGLQQEVEEFVWRHELGHGPNTA